MEQQVQLRSKLGIAMICLVLIGCNQGSQYKTQSISQQEVGAKQISAQSNNAEPTNLIPANALVICKADTNLYNQNGTIYLKDNPFTGTLFLMDGNQKDTLLIEQYLNGLEHGEWKKYYLGHRLKEQRFFEQGKKVGNYFTWWENGHLQFHYQLLNDEYEGVCKEWNEQGMLTKEMHFVKGHESGSQKWWYDNGKIKANYTIIEGRRFGLLGTKNCVNVSDSIFKY